MIVEDEDISNSDPFTAASPPLVTLPRHFVSPHSIDDDDFPPDPVEHVLDPPQVSDPLDHYPSVEMSDADEGEDESESEDEALSDKPDLEEFMDWEYLKQGKDCLFIPYHFRG